MEKQVSLIFDPRTKLFILLLCVIAASISPSLEYNLGLVLLVGITGIMCGKRRSALIGIAGYALLYALTVWAAGMTGTLKTTLLAAFGLFHKVYPCGMIGGLLISSTKVNAFMSALNRLRSLFHRFPQLCQQLITLHKRLVQQLQQFRRGVRHFFFLYIRIFYIQVITVGF